MTGRTILEPRWRTRDRGAVTAELAVALTGLVPMLLAVVCLVSVLLGQLSVTGAASSAARLIARGESRTAVEHVVRAAAGPDADLQVQSLGGLTRVTVSRQIEVPGAGQVEVRGSAVAPGEEVRDAP